MNIYLLVMALFLIFRIFLYRKFRLWLAMRRRKGIYTRLHSRIKSIKRFTLRKRKKIPYIGSFGASFEEAEVFYVITSLAHGLETMPGEIHAELLDSFDEHELIKKNISIISIPIVNHWGFKNGARTTSDGVDLLRNSPYISKLPNRKLLLSGWNNKIFWLFTRIIGFSYYFKGFRVHKILKELFAELLPILESGRPVVFYDLHTGNNRAQTTLWPHELFKKKLSKRMRRICRNNNIHLEPIPYATDGAIIEYFVEQFPDTPIQGYTIEFDVLEKEGSLHYSKQAIWGDVFEAPQSIRNEKFKKGLQQLAAVMNITLIPTK